MPQQPYLLADGLTYQLPPDRTLFRGLRVSLFAGDALQDGRGDRVALVGANGIGKSTLLQILAGKIRPTAGSVQRHGSVYYLPQISTLRSQIKHETLLEFLSTVSEEWWTIVHLLETQFHTRLDLSLPIAHLSGGELTKLFLAIGFAQTPDVLLLDEPTNHMDYLALENLQQLLNQFKGALVIVSHKPFFLDQVVQKTWELTPEGVTVYGGNFSFYRMQKQMELEAQQRSHEIARKELKRAQSIAMQEQMRAARSHKHGRQQFLNGSMDRAAAGSLKRKAEVTAGKQKQSHEAAIAEAAETVATTKVRTHKTTNIQLEQRSNKHKNLIDIQGANLWVDDRQLITEIQFQILSGDRIAISGVNGSGKSSLAKAVLQSRHTSAALKSGQILYSPDMRMVYLDQTYALVDRKLTIVENLQVANPELSYQQVRQQLGHFLFFNRDVEKSASVLSGGELARLALAMISVAKIDLLILDEPTNNLDITTVNQIIDAVNEYQGALWVISHDLDFLSQIQITRAFHVNHQGLQRMTYLPNEANQYYQELLMRSDRRIQKNSIAQN